jgi:2-dehydro-3-deoxyglucarate aldolase/4-hydroxy-2-oxoheptanedioate aldolase
MPRAPSAFAHPFRQRLRRGRARHLIWLALGVPALAEIAAQQGADAVVLDLQHGLWDRASLEAAVGLAGAHAPVLVRSADLSHQAIATALDAGASAVMAPLVETAEDASALVQAGRYPPQGGRSGGGVRPLRGGMAGMLAMGAQVALGAMIETAQGVANADAICATPGLDFIFIGTGDLALSMPDASAAQLGAACQQVLAAARQHRLPCGLFTPDAAAALAVVANDIDLARRGMAQALATARA